MFKNTDMLLHGLTETQRILKDRIAEMQYYYLMPGTKKDLIATYGFTKEASDKFTRITKVGWKCFTHDIDAQSTKTDDQIEVPVMSEPPQFGWAVPVDDVPDEVVIVLLEDEVVKCRFIESRSRSYDESRYSFLQLKTEPTKVERQYSWSNSTYFTYDSPTSLTKEKIDAYLAECTVYDLLFARQFFAESIVVGSLSASDRWGR
ncbi:hypothetical protein NVP2275O_061 [Vibrio phage 2.275.O._10N.286.54.E11]|nr:hypothetical protein NVP2275O_061 [Vibrio phage 2.275.O._10N.286.54.E11]